MKNLSYYLCLILLFTILSCSKKEETVVSPTTSTKYSSARTQCEITGYCTFPVVRSGPITTNTYYHYIENATVGQTVFLSIDRLLCSNCKSVPSGNVRYFLKKGGFYYQPIGSAPQGQNYAWTIPQLCNGTYEVVMASQSNPNIVVGGYSLTITGGISCPDFLLSPKNNDIVYVNTLGGTFNVTWDKNAVPDEMVTIDISPAGGSFTMSYPEIPNNGMNSLDIYSQSQWPRGYYYLSIRAENNTIIRSNTVQFQVLNR